MSEKKYTDPKTLNLKDLVKDGKRVKFVCFRDSEFWYEHEDGLMFPISLQEATTGRATFLANDKAIFFMRWIKRYIEACKSEPDFATGMEAPPKGKETYVRSCDYCPSPAEPNSSLCKSCSENPIGNTD